MKVSLSIPKHVADRAARRANMRGVTLEQYIVSLVDWHSPAFDNDAQYLKARLRDVILNGATGEDLLKLTE